MSWIVHVDPAYACIYLNVTLWICSEIRQVLCVEFKQVCQILNPSENDLGFNMPQI